MMPWLRSASFLSFCFGAVCIYSTAVLVMFWAPQDFLWRFVISYARLAMWAGEFFCGMKIVVEGRENIPDVPSVIMIKHSSTLETYTHVTLFPRTCWVIKRETIFMPFFGWAMWLVFRPIAIRRSSRGASAKQVIREGRARLAEGVWVTIFPEGTRMPPGETRRYGVSGAALARDAGVPIVPVAHNAADVWGRREFTKRPGTVRFCIGPPISAEGRPPRETNLLVQDWIENKMMEISSGYRQKRCAS